MAQQYRHIIAENPEQLICNHNLFDLINRDLSAMEVKALTAILNSTLIGLFKTFYGRFAGTEGNLKTEVVDVNLLEVPSPTGVSPALALRLSSALEMMQKRPVGRLVEEQLMDCHSPERAKRIAEGPIVLSHELKQPDRRALDDAVFELLGVAQAGRRAKLVDRLHWETAFHFRQIRVVELQKAEQKKKSGTRKFSAEELAVDLWDAAELEELTPIKEWIAKQPRVTAAVIIPDTFPAYLSDHAKMFDNATVYFGKDRKDHVICRSREEAELVKLLADHAVRGSVNVPATAGGCEDLKQRVEQRIAAAKARFEELAQTRTSLEEKQTEVVDLLLRWFALGRPASGGQTIQ
jgi:hypothetical protein